jgi:serine/threonine-protein kinase
MGSVWEGIHATLGTRVAVKFIDAEHAESPEARRRFENEARAAATLRSKHVVEVYDHGLMEDGRPFIVMEFLEGEPLDKRLDAVGRLPPADTARIVAQVCRALSKAHAAGIVHRDLKPENVMVNAEGLVKIPDFGLAKLHPERAVAESATASRLDSFATGPGLTFGTPAYMSPEQAMSAVVDYRSDQFALGAMMYELASGQTAFRGPSTVETLSAIVRDEPPSLTSVRADLPAPLVWIVERCLQKDPRLRYDSTGDLARDLVNLRDRGRLFRCSCQRARREPIVGRARSSAGPGGSPPCSDSW